MCFRAKALATLIAAMMAKRVIFSGIQPSGIMHLGNYLGAVRHWRQLQHAVDSHTSVTFAVMDLHSLSAAMSTATPKNGRIMATLQDDTRRMAATLLACGIDAEQCSIYVQSHVPAHAELQWYLSCIAPLGRLQRMTQFKVSRYTVCLRAYTD